MQPNLHALNLQKAHQDFLSLECQAWDVYKICLKSMNLTENELWILLEIEENQTPLRQADIARNLYLPVQTVNSALTKLTSKGLIELVSLPNNRKSKGVCLTQKGKAEFLPYLAKIHAAEQSALATLSDQEIETMLQSIRRYVTALEKNLKEQFPAAS
ncbi:MarR family winged helix-turn-helix transcriptional regulator [Allobaculum sp. JKK-2023]|uniref:MarR family winged helix-turn-helix transcriptional regulator n=1 Tax=Allobaculum sp. JKK-2023 TaxID=3108943 RepID=UPI002B053C3F|nr:MarR family transcriptional regulator [Allobaculum sp. JKK-2023]